MTGLRELKKARTRDAIADVAVDLFSARGFDDVTVDEVAQAAQVSKKTVFNYFPTKEDLVFHRAEIREAGLVEAVDGSGPGLSLVESFRRLCLRQTQLIDHLRRQGGPGSGGLFDLIHQHPALQRRLHEINARLTRQVAAALAERAGQPVDDPVAQAVATALIGAQSALFRSLRARVASGASDAVITRAHRRDVNRVFDTLSSGLADFPQPGPRRARFG